MTYLFISIAFTSLIYLIFRAFSRFGVDSFPAIVLNYASSFILSLCFLETDQATGFLLKNTGFLACGIFLGFGFIAVFNLMSQTTKLLGVAGSTVISRMSLVIPASYSLIILHERLSLAKGAGILLALVSIYFIVAGKYESEDPGKVSRSKSQKIWIPLLTFIGVGTTDLMLKFTDVNFLGGGNQGLFMSMIYGFASLAGIILLLSGKFSFGLFSKRKNLLWGLSLGVCNYFSLYFFLKALGSGIEGSKIFPINSVGIVGISTLASVLIFSEKISLQKGFGLLLALTAIMLISFG